VTKSVIDIAIDELASSQVEAAVELWRACELTRPWNDPHADAAKALAGPASTILAGVLTGRLVATAMVGADGHRAWVYYLAVAPDLRGAGLGKAMMDAVETWARGRGMPKLELMVREGNAPAEGFYEAIGYQREPVNVYSRWLSER
jgi:ribosomal protein S18 acetylase RimI-like enzyme